MRPSPSRTSPSRAVMASKAVGQSSSVPRSSPIRWLWSVTGGHLSVRAPGTVASHVMAQLIYSAITSLDGYIEDSTGGFDWAEPDEEVHAGVNDLERPIGPYLYGRRLYDTMVAWESMPTESVSAVVADYAEVWRGADKIVYSRTLTAPRSERTRIEAEFVPAEVRRLKEAVAAPLSIGGADLARVAL